MKEVKTADGSATCFSDIHGEYYHSLSGAETEAKEKYVKPCGIRPGMIILDICFGLGYNSAAAIDAVEGGELEIFALEQDTEILKKILEINTNFKKYAIIQGAVEQALSGGKIFKQGNVTLRFMLGDARTTIKEVDRKVDAVFLDPFSPKKNPELWTTGFFRNIRRVMKPDARLATYSCARQVRENMKDAGFSVEDTPPWGRRGPGTLATNIT
ncbi:MAG: hypothetical protein KJ709_09205 [Nanoarchaeota archaeon]|nr:hypothetical protein [Nanoarchaeota archaeon]